MPFASINGIQINYDVHGSGDALVLISGLGYDKWQWHMMVPGLAEHFTVITLDNRGAGDSDKPAGPYTASLLAADVAALLDALHMERAAVMGHSMGGFVAQAFALEHADRLTKLILSATNFGGPRHIPITAEAMAVLTDTKSDPIERLRRGIAISCAAGFADAHPDLVQMWIDYRVAHPIDPAGYQAQLAIGLGLLAEAACFEHKLSAITAPTLILFGAQDKVVPPGNAELLARQIPHSTIALLPDAGHFFPFETPDAANAVIVNFLKG